MQIPKYFATKNLNKLKEINEILGAHLEHITLELEEPQGLNLQEIVCGKAKAAYQKFGQPILVEDTSLEFEAWHGLPGPLVKWFLESVGNAGILQMLGNEKNRVAVAKTAFAFFDGQNCHTFMGETRGEIATNLHGEEKFGWDVIFIPKDHNKTFAEMDATEKNSISMRARALLDLKRHL